MPLSNDGFGHLWADPEAERECVYVDITIVEMLPRDHLVAWANTAATCQLPRISCSPEDMVLGPDAPPIAAQRDHMIRRAD